MRDSNLESMLAVGVFKRALAHKPRIILAERRLAESVEFGVCPGCQLWAYVFVCVSECPGVSRR